jgi:hypothetical protein
MKFLDHLYLDLWVLLAVGLKLSFAQEKEIRGEKEGKESLVGKVGIICY